jgi:hypothetical protein
LRLAGGERVAATGRISQESVVGATGWKSDLPFFTIVAVVIALSKLQRQHAMLAIKRIHATISALLPF